MNDLIYTPVGQFTSVREPYIGDRFVHTMFTKPGNADTAYTRFEQFLRTQPFLTRLLEGLAAEAEDGTPLEVVDAGVFMGNFSIAVHVQAKRLGINTKITAYEANITLVEPIRRNFDIYDLPGKVFANGISGKREVVEFVHSVKGMIGGTAYMPENKRNSAEGYMTTSCEIIPLRDALSGNEAPGLVKLDIEGSEVDAFGSIAGDAARLNNVFIVEFAPYQGKLDVAGARFDAFMLKHFAVFDISSWLWSPFLCRLETPESLETCLQVHKNRPHNTDLLLIPHHMSGVIAQIETFGAQRATKA